MSNKSGLYESGKAINTLLEINNFISENKFPPSIRDLADTLGVNSTSVMSHRIDFLVRHGWITKKDRVARSIVITKKGRDVINAAKK